MTWFNDGRKHRERKGRSRRCVCFDFTCFKSSLHIILSYSPLDLMSHFFFHMVHLTYFHTLPSDIFYYYIFSKKTIDKLWVEMWCMVSWVVGFSFLTLFMGEGSWFLLFSCHTPLLFLLSFSYFFILLTLVDSSTYSQYSRISVCINIYYGFFLQLLYECTVIHNSRELIVISL